MKSRSVTGIAVGLLAMFGTGCRLFVPASIPCTDLANTATPSPLSTTLTGASWLYQLQSAEPAAIASSTYEMSVIDWSSDGSESGVYSSDEIDEIRSGGTHTVLAYVSVGEAEDYRGYFDQAWVNNVTGQPRQDAPCWLGRTNPDWPGNYKVQYWSSDWHAIVLSMIDTVINAGFDGVYLDIIDAYEYWSDSQNADGFSITEREAGDRMINLVLTIAVYARQTDPDFLVIPQNGEAILAFDDGEGSFRAEAYLDSISGIGIEDLYFDATDEVDSSITNERVEYLVRIRDAGKTVLVVDYVDDGSDRVQNETRITEFRSLATADGFVPYAARSDRELNEIN